MYNQKNLNIFFLLYDVFGHMHNLILSFMYWSTMGGVCNCVDQIDHLFKLQMPKCLIC